MVRRINDLIGRQSGLWRCRCPLRHQPPHPMKLKGFDPCRGSLAPADQQTGSEFNEASCGSKRPTERCVSSDRPVALPSKALDSLSVPLRPGRDRLWDPECAARVSVWQAGVGGVSGHRSYNPIPGWNDPAPASASAAIGRRVRLDCDPRHHDSRLPRFPIPHQPVRVSNRKVLPD